MNPYTNTNHRQAALMHFCNRARTRLNRHASKLDVDKIRLAFLRHNDDLFMLESVYDDTMIGIVKFQNIHTRAVFDRVLGIPVTVGV